MRHEMKSQAVKFMTSTLAGVLSLLNLSLTKLSLMNENWNNWELMGAWGEEGGWLTWRKRRGSWRWRSIRRRRSELRRCSWSRRPPAGPSPAPAIDAARPSTASRPTRPSWRPKRASQDRSGCDGWRYCFEGGGRSDCGSSRPSTIMTKPCAAGQGNKTNKKTNPHIYRWRLVWNQVTSEWMTLIWIFRSFTLLSRLSACQSPRMPMTVNLLTLLQQFAKRLLKAISYLYLFFSPFTTRKWIVINWNF